METSIISVKLCGVGAELSFVYPIRFWWAISQRPYSWLTPYP